MIIARKIEKELLEWKNRNDHMSLMVDGARQVGKTFSIRKFGKENYDKYIEFNFIKNESLKTIFDGDFDVETFMKQTTLRMGWAEFKVGKTLVFLDEIQACPNAQAALKFFTEDRRFDVIASGSLLGISYKEVPSFPVGQIDHLDMYPLDFEEFLMACGVPRQSFEDLRDYYETLSQVPPAFDGKMVQLFREYVVVGGMPRVVAAFVEHHDFSEVLRIQRGILHDYRNDIASYAEDSEKVKVRACFDSIPRQLSKDYKKFQYSLVEKGGTTRKYGGSLVWLKDAGIIEFCHNLGLPQLPLEGNAISDEFKVYMGDTGLLIAMLEDGSQADIIGGDLGIYKGAVYENMIASILVKAKRRLYYYAIPGKMEIDFFIRMKGKLTALEVKAADNTKAKSLALLQDKFSDMDAFLLSMKNTHVGDRTIRLPQYMAFFLAQEKA